MKPIHLLICPALCLAMLTVPIATVAQTAAPAPDAPASPDALESPDLDPDNPWTRDMECNTKAIAGAIVGAAIGARIGERIGGDLAETTGAAVGFSDARQTNCDTAQ